jgi:hypothetical protein
MTCTGLALWKIIGKHHVRIAAIFFLVRGIIVGLKNEEIIPLWTAQETDGDPCRRKQKGNWSRKYC